MVFIRLGRWYLRSLQNHPWKTQLVTSGCLAATGDIIAQVGIAKLENGYDIKRTARFFGFGCFYFAPILRTWYGILNRYVHVRKAPVLSPLLRVAIDQFLFAPVFVSTFLVLLRLAEGNDFKTAIRRWRQDFFDIYMTGLKIWPATQLINFYFIPVQFQMLLVQVVALFWNCYLAWRTNRHVDLTGAVTY